MPEETTLRHKENARSPCGRAGFRSKWFEGLAAVSRSADLDDVLRRRALLALDDVELDAVTLGEGLEALALDPGGADESILRAVLRGDETETPDGTVRRAARGGYTRGLMSPKAREVLEQALALDEADRATVAGALIESLETPSEPGAEQAWSEVIRRRVAELQSGDVQPVPWSEVRERLFRGFE